MSVRLETRGDIFESKASVLLCPANTVGAMGKGLAKAFGTATRICTTATSSSVAKVGSTPTPCCCSARHAVRTRC